MTILSNTTLSLWGKKNINKDSEEVWLPLIAHLIDTKKMLLDGYIIIGLMTAKDAF